MNFPKIVLTRDDGSLHPSYRCIEENGLEEFEYFFDRIVSRLRPRDTKYKDRRTKEPLSAIFTPSDEAFALLIIYNEIERWENIPDPVSLETTEVSKKRKWKNTVEKKFCSATRGSMDGWKDEGKKLYYALVENIERLRKDPVTGSDFEHKLMVKWMIEKREASGENMNGITYSTFEDDEKGLDANKEDYMTQTNAYRKMRAEYDAVMKEVKNRERIKHMDTYLETRVSENLKNV